MILLRYQENASDETTGLRLTTQFHRRRRLHRWYVSYEIVLLLNTQLHRRRRRRRRRSSGACTTPRARCTRGRRPRSRGRRRRASTSCLTRIATTARSSSRIAMRRARRSPPRRRARMPRAQLRDVVLVIYILVRVRVTPRDPAPTHADLRRGDEAMIYKHHARWEYYMLVVN